MKQLQLELNKRLLIVEPKDLGFSEEKVIIALGDAERYISDLTGEKRELQFICKGSDLTEDIAKGFLHQSLHTGLFAHYVKDIPVNTYCYKKALEAFDAVIYAYGYHWKNHLGISTEEIRQRHGDASDMFNEWLEYEKKTFNPSKCIIFEIL